MTGFDPGFERPACLATLKSSDRTKQSVSGWLYIYIYIYIYIYMQLCLNNCIKHRCTNNWIWFLYCDWKTIEKQELLNIFFYEKYYNLERLYSPNLVARVIYALKYQFSLNSWYIFFMCKRFVWEYVLEEAYLLP